MFTWARPLVRLRPESSVLAVFALTILLPGLLLAVFGARALLQERGLADQQIRERIDRAADTAVRDVEREIGGWQTALETIRDNQRLDAEALPDRLRRLVDESGAGVVVRLGSQARPAWPDRQLLYEPNPDLTGLSLQPRVTGALAEAETVELRQKNYGQAILLYKRLVAAAKPGQQPWLLQRLARTYRKAGRDDEALSTFQALESSHELIGGVPSDLVAKFEICSTWNVRSAADRLVPCALELYGDLVGGRWRLEKSRYLFYAARARAWLATGPAVSREVTRWTALEERKQSLTDAVAGVFEAAPPSGDRQSAVLMDAGTHLAVLRFARGGGPSEGLALVMAKSWLESHVWPATFDRAVNDGFDVALLGSNGEPWFGSADTKPRGATRPTWTTTRTLQNSTVPLRVQVRPHDPAALSAELTRRQRVYLVMLGLVVALLGFGTYLTTRVVKREGEIARLQSDFVSTVSHEFRSPLTGIRQLGEMLMRGRVPTEARRQEYYERITRESDRLARLVENLLDFARMEEGRREYRFETLDAVSWLRRVVADFESQRADGRVAVVVTMPDALPAVLGDRQALTCAVENLLDNAIKYSPGRDTVWLQAQASNSHVTISVRDEGVGIDEPDRKRIFEKFYRGRGDITRVVKGAGLGLSLVRHIVDAHGGEVQCQSRPGDGTTFSIHLRSAV